VAANVFNKASLLRDTTLALLEREIVLPGLVWRDPGGSFRGALGDTISLRLPAYAEARTRTLRSGAARTKDTLHERVVDVKLDTDIYFDVDVTVEQLTLDIRDFGAQVLNPIVSAHVRRYEQIVADLMADADYPDDHNFELNASDPYHSFVDARKLLNDARVPMDGRVAVVGSSVEAALLKSEQFARADQAGDANALRGAIIGRVAGFNVVTAPAVDPDEAYVFHRTAFALSSQAPDVPQGASAGFYASGGGFSMLVVQNMAADDIIDQVKTSAFAGAQVVKDHGEFVGGRWVPSTDPDLEDGTDLEFVRAVRIGPEAS